MHDGTTDPGQVGGERRRELRYAAPPSLRLWLRPPGLRGWLQRRSRPLLDCSQSGLAWLDLAPPQVGERLLCDLRGGGWSLWGVPGRVRTVDRLVRDHRVGFEFAREELSSRRARQLALALTELDSGTLGG